MAKPSLVVLKRRIRYARAAESALRVQRFMLEDNFFNSELNELLKGFVCQCLDYIKDNT